MLARLRPVDGCYTGCETQFASVQCDAFSLRICQEHLKSELLGGNSLGMVSANSKFKKTSVPQLLLHCAQRETGATRKQKLWSREQTKFSRTPPVGTLQMKATQTWRGLCPGNLAWFVSACATTCPNMPQQYKMYKWMFHRIPRKK